ncbi:DUF6386 family protein [uncultured Pseudoteredinibacter sp.]|uniref:DUF6386 family protein n=1 Tax=uncultured Pseudoteredinibacter sp. TaxID=1641701 RepID=UPI002610AAC5|nr:DUF6386 family protein [uncultured Pseudoteredinibacter sp.]
MRVQTDTATILLYDLACLKHRLSDACDWWSIPRKEIEEINSGNVIFIGTGCDGVFEIEITEDTPPEKAISFTIKNKSGKFFLGGGECVSGEDLEPDEDDGIFLDYPPGNYQVTAWEGEGKCILNISLTSKQAVNSYASSPKIP